LQRPKNRRLTINQRIIVIHNIDKGRLSRGGQDAAGTRRLAHTLAFIGALCSAWSRDAQPTSNSPGGLSPAAASRGRAPAQGGVCGTASGGSCSVGRNSDGKLIFMNRSTHMAGGSMSSPMDVAGFQPAFERDWRPYCNGHWQRTEAGWYWVSDDPGAWATYH